MKNLRIVHEDFSNPKDIAAFLSLKDPKIFEYEYLKYMPDKYIFVTVRSEDDKILGSQSIMPYILNINGKDVLTGRSERTLVVGKMRGKGLCTRMYQECITYGKEKGIQFIWGTTLAIRALQKAGFIFHHDYWEHSICYINSKRFIKYLKSENDVSRKFKMAQTVTMPLSMAARRFFRGIDYSDDIEICEQAKRPEDIREIYDVLRGNDTFIHLVQDSRFLRWAYELDPKRRYLRLYAYRDRKLISYIHLDITHPYIARLVDFAEVEKGRLSSLIKEAMRRLMQGNHNAIHASYNIRNPQLRSAAKTLYTNGFIVISRTGHKCIRPIDFIDMNILGDIRPWYITEIWNTLSETSSILTKSG